MRATIIATDFVDGAPVKKVLQEVAEKKKSLEKELEVPHFFESDPDSPSSEKRIHPKFDRPQSLDIPAFKNDHKD